MKNSEITAKIAEIEAKMAETDFWQDKDLAQKMIQELQDLKDAELGLEKHDKSNAVVNIFAGAGGDDAEDWVRMLFDMYMKFADKQNWQISFLDQNQNDNGGYRSITLEVVGKNVYGTLKNESGVHRLVRKSPFNSAGKRQTSFAMVEIIPQFENNSEIKINDEEIEIEFTKSSGPGGQNVNKRETAVRITHKETGINAFVSTERSQAQNKEKALEIIRGKLYKLKQDQEKGEIRDMSISRDTKAEWGSQIRSYVMHPYKLVKDHRTETETSNIDSVLSGEIDLFIKAMKGYNNTTE